MSFSNALIPWNPDANTAVATIPENARPEGGRWALILNVLLSPSPGRTLDRVYTSIGKVMETQANRAAHALGLGPHVIAGKIKSYFGNGEERVRQLELLRTVIPTKLEQKCRKLMKYTLPTEAANTQSQAFKEIVDLVTMYPGLRVLFVQTKPLVSATSLALDAISALWDRSTGAPDKEWIFWRSLTANCLTDSLISAVLEKSFVTDLGKCHYEGLGVIERLLIEHCCASSEYSSALCVRYLAGVLDLPEFWLTMGTVHAHVTDKLCHRLGQVLNDIGVDIPALGPRDDSEKPFDYDGLDTLAVTVLRGISSWFTKIQQKDWSVQPWYESFAKVLRLLRAPRAADLLPHSHNYASNAFDTIVPTTYHGSELHVMVDGENTTSKEQPSHEDKNLTDFKSENMSTPSLHSDTSNQDHTPSVEYMDETESQHSGQDSAEPLTEDDESILMSDLSDVESIQMDFASNISAEREDPSRPDFGYGQDVVGDWNHDTMDIQQISAKQGLLNVTSYPSLADQWKWADEWRTILQQRQSDLGDNHLDTLEAMESLAWVEYELGQFKTASDLHAVVLEKRIILLGNDDPLTLTAMQSLGKTYGALGQNKRAESLLQSVLDRQKEFLGEHHPQTLLATIDLAMVYRNLGQLKQAEGLQIFALEKQRDLFGENNVETVTAMRDLAMTYHHQGQYQKAQELFASALEKYREMLSEDHPNTLETMSHLAATYGNIGQHKESEQLRQIVLQKRRTLLGEDHPDTLTAMVELASAYTSLGQLENAESLLVVALKKHKDLLGEDHPRTLRTMGLLVKTYVQLGQFTTAEELALVALEKRQKVLGEDHPDTLRAMGNLGWTYQMQGRFDHAEELYVVLFEKWRKLLGDDHPDTKWTTESLAWIYRALGKIQAAEEVERLLEVEH